MDYNLTFSDKKYFVEYLSFDTEIFGIKCGRLHIKQESLSNKELQDILKKAEEYKFKHLVVKLPAEFVSLCNLLENYNFRFKICSIELEKKIEHSSVDISGVSLFNEKDRDRLIKITEDAFSIGTRFHYEPKFTPEKAIELHRKWICNLINDRGVKIYTHRIRDVITGYITVKFSSDNKRKGHIGLFAVDKKYRGQGIGSKLIKGLESNIYGTVDTVNAITESINYPALKVYFHTGFIAEKSWNIFHLNL